MSKKLSVSELRGRELVKLKKELKLSKNDLIQAEQVVESARDKKKYPNLHSRFEWNDKKASQEYRIWQARELFVEVTILTREKKRIPGYVSLKSDRKEPGGGYRETISVLSNREMREELLQQAWDDFSYWREKYEYFRELAPIFATADKVSKKLKQSKSKKKKKR